jgi:hypothetical protein
MTQRDDGLQQNTYFIDAESGTELARLQLQDRLINQHLGGPLPAPWAISPGFMTFWILPAAQAVGRLISPGSILRCA